MTTAAPINLVDLIRDIPDFPKPGILFRDITPLLQCPAAFRETIRQLAEPFRGQGIELIAAAEARGFIFAAPLALEAQRRADSHSQAGKAAGQDAFAYLRPRIWHRHLAGPRRCHHPAGLQGADGRRSAGHRRYDRRLLHDDRTGRWCGGGLRLRDRAGCAARPASDRPVPDRQFDKVLTVFVPPGADYKAERAGGNLRGHQGPNGLPFLAKVAQNGFLEDVSPIFTTFGSCVPSASCIQPPGILGKTGSSTPLRKLFRQEEGGPKWAKTVAMGHLLVLHPSTVIFALLPKWCPERMLALSCSRLSLFCLALSLARSAVRSGAPD